MHEIGNGIATKWQRHERELERLENEAQSNANEAARTKRIGWLDNEGMMLSQLSMVDLMIYR